MYLEKLKKRLVQYYIFRDQIGQIIGYIHNSNEWTKSRQKPQQMSEFSNELRTLIFKCS